MEVLEHHIFRVTRNEDLEVEEDDAENLLQALEKELMRRRFGPPVRLEVEESIDRYVLDLLVRELKISEAEVYPLPGPLDLTGLFGIGALDRPELKYPKFIAGTHRDLAEVESASAPDIFAALRERDVLLHHPYDSFSTSVQAFLEQAAADPDVLAIKQTLYRTSGDSPIVDALIDAAESGKQVLVLVEIKARFDEQANIKWARKLEESGCHVVYGLVGLKTHCKLSLVVRQEGDTLRRYSHVGTGNYHPKTARLYEDLGLLTADPQVGADLSDLFNRLSGYSRRETYRRLLVAPKSLRDGLIAADQQGGPAPRAPGVPRSSASRSTRWWTRPLIDALYRASQAGVPVDIWVRGICAVRPGVTGLSENIRVRSVLGRFLEHSRVFAFGNGGEPEVWIGSADMMHRNLDRRIEALVRVTDPAHRAALEPAAGDRDVRHHLLLAPRPRRRVDPARDRRGRPAPAERPGDAHRRPEAPAWHSSTLIPPPARRPGPPPRSRLPSAGRAPPPVTPWRATCGRRPRSSCARCAGTGRAAGAAAGTGESGDAARSLRRSARRISGSLHTFRPLLDADWSEAMRPELAWLSGTLAREHAYAARLERLLGALNRLSGTAALPLPGGDRTPAAAPKGNLTVGAAKAGALLDRQLTLARTRAHSAALQALGSSRFHAVADSVAVLASEVPLAPAAGRRRPAPAGRRRRRTGWPTRWPRCRWSPPDTPTTRRPSCTASPPTPSPSRRTRPGTRSGCCCGCTATRSRCCTAGSAPSTDGCSAPDGRSTGTATRRRPPSAAAAAARTPRIAPATAYALGVLHADQRHEVEAARFAFQQAWQKEAVPHPVREVPWPTTPSSPRAVSCGAAPRPAPGLEICLVHRPKYDDWSHPKGKLKRGEAPLAGALREVAEETGHGAVPGAVLPTLRYEVAGRPKEVRYWAAEAAGGAFTPNGEVDRVLWLSPGAARDRLTQPRDRDLVDALLDALHVS